VELTSTGCREHHDDEIVILDGVEHLTVEPQAVTRMPMRGSATGSHSQKQHSWRMGTSGRIGAWS